MSGIGSIWGAKDSDPSLEDKAVESIQETFERGIRAGKLSLMKDVDKYMMREPFTTMGHADVLIMLRITNDEYNAMVLQDPDYFDIDRLPQIMRNIKLVVREYKADQVGLEVINEAW